MEIERKFLVPRVPEDLAGHPSHAITQGYLITAGSDLEVRVRSRDGAATLTVKQGAGRTRDERETPIPADRFDRLWPLTEGRRIEKTRTEIPFGDGLVIELDTYAGALAGLAVAEVEFPSEAAADAFAPPAWFGPEVTLDERYKNRQLAVEGRPQATAPAFRFTPGAPLDAEVVRVVREQIDIAGEQLSGRGGDPAEAVHEARKAFKRVRAVLRLARGVVDDGTYERESARFRELGHALSSARDSQVLVDTLDGVVARAGGAPDGRFAALRAQLAADLSAAEVEGDLATRVADEALGGLADARTGLAGWRFDATRLDALAPGIEAIYRRGRRAWRTAGRDRADESFHALRKRSKELWHAAELLAAADPQRVGRLERRAHRLADLVGDDHDLAVLAAYARDHPDCFADAAEHDALDMLIVRRRRKLQSRALRQGARVYRGKPRKLRERVARGAR